MNQWTTCWTSSEDAPLIAGIGAATAVGRSAWAGAAAVRAGIAGFAAHAYMVDANGRPMIVAPMPWIEEAREIAERIGDALVAAVGEALAPWIEAQPESPVQLWVNLPSPRPMLPDDLGQQIVERLHDAFGACIGHLAVAGCGHAGGLLALRSAAGALADRSDAACVVAAADSYLDPDTLEWLEETDQLHGAGERNNAWGFVPGEGAGALLLVSSHMASRLALPALGRLRGLGLGHEQQRIGTGSVCIGLGLTEAVRGALNGLQGQARVTDVYCDMNGEPYRGDEYAFLVTRTRERFVAASDFVAPADCWGDVGAASAPLLIGLACIAMVKGYALGGLALVWASSVMGERGAVLVGSAS